VTVIRSRSVRYPPLRGSEDVEVFQSVLQLLAFPMIIFTLQLHNKRNEVRV
jgi:hypothetical protein